MKLIYLICLLSFCLDGFTQGNIDHIKNQPYLKDKDKVDCNNITDNLSERICANLAFQKSDSFLKVIYDSLLIEAKQLKIDSSELRIINLQEKWREFRDQHCSLIHDLYKDCGSCHQQAIDYLNCLRELTDDRIKELIRLRKQLAAD